MPDNGGSDPGAPPGVPGGRTSPWLVLRSLASSAATVAMLVALYSIAPLDTPVDAWTALALVAGLLVFGAVVALQVRAIVHADHPRLRAIQALSCVIPLFLLLFSATYFMIARSTPDSFTERLGRTDALYFTITVFATVGFGDIAPVTADARIATTVQMVLDVLLVGVIAKVLLGAVQIGLRRRGAQTGSAGTEEAAGDPGGTGGTGGTGG
ncbi:potassium channel family protein [Streptacidiphilus sp. ASG 303]|uniref:potassium channel family protein n=1 Tax=Streptacidiphilus sp. ASG 303 TaxID=2896847 RepID=UPI001E59CB1C|nr:potassium channel family protein [Streptacidiphilus sp. ASG 303]MCD0484470.1 potassium channel family protein [Streptacidiphilus sp. ASG 303]